MTERGEREEKAKLTFPFLSLLFFHHNEAYKHTHYDDDDACIRDIIRNAKSHCNEMKRAEEKIRYAEMLRCG
jgi:hypothetical protein